MNLLLLILGALVAGLVARTLFASRPALSPVDAQRAVEAGTAVLVDVREAAEWSGGVARPAALLSFSDLRGARRQWRPFLEKNRSKQIIVYCASGARSGSAAALLRREGLNAVNLGGFARWAGAGLPVRQPS